MFAQRQDILLNNDWNFRFSHQVQKGTEVRVDLPHTWNAQDALSGKIDYKRGIGNYEKNLFIRPEWKGKRLFIRFEGVNNIADVFINRRHIGEHRGGYGAFIFEITGKVEYGKENSILVRVNNGEQLDIIPINAISNQRPSITFYDDYSSLPKLLNTTNKYKPPRNI